MAAGGPRRILFVDHTAAMGGGEIAILNVFRGMDRKRFTPVVVLFAEGPLAEKLRAGGVGGVETHIFPLDAAVGGARKDALGAGAVLKIGKLWAAAGFVRRLARFIRELRPDVVHTNSLKADVLAGFAALRAGAPCVWHVRDRIASDYLPGAAARVMRRLARWVPARVVANSAATLETLRMPARFLKSGRARVVHDGVAAEWLAEKTQNAKLKTQNAADAKLDTSAAQSSALSTAPLRIGIIGRISPWKGQDVFLRAAAEVIKRSPVGGGGEAGEARFEIIGAALFAEHAFEEKLRGMVRELGLEKSVAFLGFREDVRELVGQLDILVHASTVGEPFGQVVAEGMAGGCAVIATRGGGVPEIVIDGESGLLVPMGDHMAMAAAIERLAGDANLRRRLGEAGRKRIAEHFTIEKTVRELEAVWEELSGVPAAENLQRGAGR